MRKNNYPNPHVKHSPEIEAFTEKRKFDTLMMRLQTTGKRQALCIYLKKARLKKGLSQFDLAFLMGVNQNYVSRIEAGKINITINNLLMMVYYLDCHIRLFGSDEVKKN
jgi:ribosome-binding protein aMBF1 (putative translation factor)